MVSVSLLPLMLLSLLVLVSHPAVLPVRGETAVCDPPCGDDGMQQCIHISNGPNRCVNAMGYGPCEQAADCPAQDGFELICWANHYCIPAELFDFECSDSVPCESPQVCTQFVIPGTNSHGWCVEPGQLYSPCTETSQCDGYDMIYSIQTECRAGYCQLKGLPTACVEDSDCGEGSEGCDQLTHYCKGVHTTGDCTSDDQCGTYGCDTTTHKCRLTPDPLACTATSECLTGMVCDLTLHKCKTVDHTPIACESDDECGSLGCDMVTHYCKVDTTGLGGDEDEKDGATLKNSYGVGMIFTVIMATLAFIRKM